MVFWHLRSRRKKTGGRAKTNKKKKKYQRGGYFVPTKIGETKLKENRVRGGNIKLKLLKSEFVNVGGKKLKIVDFVENKANFKFNREKTITKGAIIVTEKGKVKITSRPGQHGVLNGVFIE
jgi:small subunit ribosomal protein S8e